MHVSIDMDMVELEELAKQICEAGFPEEFSFQNKLNRNYLANRVRYYGAKVRLSSTRNQLIDPRYTVEGRHLPDKGLGNDKIMTNLYHLVRVL